MLQQTTVETVLPRFERFLKRFPTVQALARARLDSVLSEWSGLGYYARARNLHRAAGRIVTEHGGAIPSDYEGLRSLPGLGDYTASAILAIAFDRYALPLDANIRRVASRVFASHDPKKELAKLVSRARPGDSVAALFDLGQLLCRPRSPLCADCPLCRQCAAFRLGRVRAYPRGTIRPARRTIHLAVAAIAGSRGYFLRRRESSWLGGMWEFPSADGRRRQDARKRLELSYRLSAKPLVSLRHAVVGRDLMIDVYRAEPEGASGRGRWMSPGQIARGAAPTLTKKVARSLAGIDARA
jgi:A/G-specific adenine glycosylase